MIKKMSVLGLAVAVSIGLSGCEQIQTAGVKQSVGAGVGAILGGYAGSKIGGGSGQLIAVGVGTLLGGLVGSELGKSLDQADMMYAQRANYEAHSAPLGEAISWSNPDTGNSGTVVPVREGKDSAGRYCREYQQTIYVGGQQETGYGTACRRSDGTWEIVS